MINIGISFSGIALLGNLVIDNLSIGQPSVGTTEDSWLSSFLWVPEANLFELFSITVNNIPPAKRCAVRVVDSFCGKSARVYFNEYLSNVLKL